MSAKGSISLGLVAAHTAALTIAGSRCERTATYRLDALIARHGSGFGIPYDLCGVHCPDLPAFFQPLPAKASP
jgi:hypothetical protein